ncbi:pectinesterase inhibitor 28-like [Wolffia australiana]
MAKILNLLIILFLGVVLVQGLAVGTAGDADLIRRTCNSTTFFDLCVSSLQSDPRSFKSDVKGLSVIVIKLGISNATRTSSFSSRLVKRKRDAALGSALQGCAARYADARVALRSALDALTMDEYDFASLHVSAAAAYADMCHSLFRLSPELDYPPALATGEKALVRLCAIASDIISLLG